MGHTETQGAGMAQWWDPSPPTNVAMVRFRPSALGELGLLLVLSMNQAFFSEFVQSVLRDLPPYTKTNIYKSQLDQYRGPAWTPAKADMGSFLTLLLSYVLINYLNMSNTFW